MARFTRRRLGGYRYPRGPFGSSVALRPVPFRRKRPYPSTGLSSAPPRLGRRVRPRYAQSFTRTLTKTKRKRRAGGQGFFAHSYCNFGGRRRSRAARSLRNSLTRRYDYTNSSNYQTCSSGLQSSQIWASHFTLADLQRIQALCESTGAAQAKLKFFVEKVVGSMHIKNQSNGIVYLTLYNVMCKATGTSASYDDPVEAYKQGLVDLGSTGADTVVGNSPYTSPAFLKHWRIVKKIRIALMPGDVHVHRYKFTPNRMLDAQFFQYNSFQSISYLTHHVMCVMHGEPSNTAGADNTVTTANGKIDVVVTEQTTFSYVSGQLHQVNVSNNLAAPAIVEGRIDADWLTGNIVST